MNKLVVLAVALSSLVAVAAGERDVGKSLRSGLTSFKSSTESFSSGDFSFGSGNFLLGDRDAYEGAPMVVPIGYLVKSGVPTYVRFGERKLAYLDCPRNRGTLDVGWRRFFAHAYFPRACLPRLYDAAHRTAGSTGERPGLRTNQHSSLCRRPTELKS